MLKPDSLSGQRSLIASLGPRTVLPADIRFRRQAVKHKVGIAPDFVTPLLILNKVNVRQYYVMYREHYTVYSFLSLRATSHLPVRPSGLPGH
jgi:hypothetical protein